MTDIHEIWAAVGPSVFATLFERVRNYSSEPAWPREKHFKYFLITAFPPLTKHVTSDH